MTTTCCPDASGITAISGTSGGVILATHTLVIFSGKPRVMGKPGGGRTGLVVLRSSSTPIRTSPPEVFAIAAIVRSSSAGDGALVVNGGAFGKPEAAKIEHVLPS